MTDQWFNRLVEAVERDGRSMRKISLAADCGPNYVQQIIKDGKAPSIDKLMRVLNALGSASILYVLTGARFSKEDEEFFSLVLRMDPGLREKAKAFFLALQENEETK